MEEQIDAGTTIGLVTLSVADLAGSLEYYTRRIGLRLLEQHATAATLGAGTQPLLRLVEQPGARLVRRATGLYHFALRLPTRRDLARMIRHLVDLNTPIGGASDHLVSEALYLSDIDGHGIEIYRDRDRSAWYDAQGRFQMDTRPLDVPGVMAELTEDEPAWNGLPEATDMGHIHLQVADVAAARQFYTEVLGFQHMTDYPSASFVSAGGYHHHIGMNSWASAGAAAPPDNAARLISYEIVLPSAAACQSVIEHVHAAGVAAEPVGDGWAILDPSLNRVIVRAIATG